MQIAIYMIPAIVLSTFIIGVWLGFTTAVAYTIFKILTKKR